MFEGQSPCQGAAYAAFQIPLPLYSLPLQRIQTSFKYINFQVYYKSTNIHTEMGILHFPHHTQKLWVLQL